MSNIKYVELSQVVEEQPVRVPDLIAPAGMMYKSKLNGCVFKEVIFQTYSWNLGVKLDEPIIESENDFELVLVKE